MKKIYNHLHLLLVAVFMLSSCSMTKMMFLEDESKYEFDKTVEELGLSLEKNEWKVAEKRDMKEHYAHYGYETRDIITFEICKPKGAVDILIEKNTTAKTTEFNWYFRMHCIRKTEQTNWTQ